MKSASVACCRDGLDYSHGRSHESSLACLHDLTGMLCSNDLMDLLGISTSDDIVCGRGCC